MKFIVDSWLTVDAETKQEATEQALIIYADALAWRSLVNISVLTEEEDLLSYSQEEREDIVVPDD